MARRALTRAASTLWFSYLSSESSTNLRACAERVETGMLPKICCGRAMEAIFAAEVVVRALATATRGAGVCAQAGTPHREGKSRRRTRAEKRFMSTHLFCVNDACRMKLACEARGGILAGGTGCAGWLRFQRSRTVRHKKRKLPLC